MSGLSEQSLRERIRAQGLRVTSARLAVLRVLDLHERPLSHSEVCAEVDLSEIDQATVYRNLLRLSEAQLVHSLSVDGIERYSLADPAHRADVHPHFLCNECQVVTCLPPTSLDVGLGKPWVRSIADADLQLSGVCPECRGEPSS